MKTPPIKEIEELARHINWRVTRKRGQYQLSPRYKGRTNPFETMRFTKNRVLLHLLTIAWWSKRCTPSYIHKVITWEPRYTMVRGWLVPDLPGDGSLTAIMGRYWPRKRHAPKAQEGA